MDDLVVRVKSPAMTACGTCPLCLELLNEATTIPVCLHTFCRKCIHDMLSVKDVDSCPVCNTDLGCSPINKLRPDHALQSLRDKIFPQKNMETEISGTMPLVALPTKRKERSLSSPVTLPRVTGRKVASCHTLASPFEEHSPKSDDPSKDCLMESKPAESPKKSGEGKHQSAGAYGFQGSRNRAYPVKVELLSEQLMTLLLEDPMTEESYSRMRMIIYHLHGQTIPQSLGAVCAIFNLDFWHDWEEYKDACTDLEALSHHISSLGQGRSREMIEDQTRLDSEAERIQEELSSVSAEIALLRAKEKSLQEAWMTNRAQAEELAAQMDRERNEEEAKRRSFTP